MTSGWTSAERPALAAGWSAWLKLFGLGVLVLFLLIPVLFIANLIHERRQRRDEAVGEVSAKWGQAQTLLGPALVVPYQPRPRKKDDAPLPERQLVLLPRTLDAKGRVESELRRRGIFTIPVYRADLALTGEFVVPTDAELGVDAQSIGWDRAQLALGVTDPRAIQSGTSLVWNGKPRSFLPGLGNFTDAPGGIHARVELAGIHAPVDLAGGERRFTYSIPLKVNGSLGLYVTPVGENTVVELASNSASPSFQGSYLPVQRRVSDDGFNARWEVPFLGRNFPQTWTTAEGPRYQVMNARFGVEFADPVDEYRMADRSVKYAVLFLLLTFGALWLMEVLAGVQVHPIQYLLLGAALCLFYLLELSLAEHIGFGPAYAIASIAVVALIASYSKAVLGRGALAAGVGAGIALLYAYLYVLLRIEDYALLAGSVGLFLVLAAVMFVTRRVNWYATGSPSTPRRPPVESRESSAA